MKSGAAARRALKLIWAGAYVAMVVGAVAAGLPDWAGAACGCGCGALLIAYDMRYPSYHGMGCWEINPHAETWFTSRLAARQR